MNALILLADGFETVEALQTYDVLQRSKMFQVRLVSVSSSLTVRSSHGVTVQADALLNEVDAREEDILILPGGKLGVENLGKNEKVLELIRYFLQHEKDVHAICAAPSILGKLGYLNDVPYTCFPGFETNPDLWQDVGVVETKHIITGRSMGYTLPFAKTIVAHYFGEKTVEAIRPGIEGLR
ncbi:MAG: DJ-1/PfpI family protein [Bacilli bacterium]|nr:DJ-1/PfpI family protein [Bacilli bacterium]